MHSVADRKSLNKTRSLGERMLQRDIYFHLFSTVFLTSEL